MSSPQAAPSSFNASTFFIGWTRSSTRNKTYLPADYTPSPVDILCGRGRECFNHEGNRRFRRMIDLSLPRYLQAETKTEKTSIVSSIVDNVRWSRSNNAVATMPTVLDQNDNERCALFIRFDRKAAQWFEIGDEAAREKVGQTIREMLIQRDPEKRAKKRRNRALHSQSTMRNHGKPTQSPSFVPMQNMSAFGINNNNNSNNNGMSNVYGNNNSNSMNTSIMNTSNNSNNNNNNNSHTGKFSAAVFRSGPHSPVCKFNPTTPMTVDLNTAASIRSLLFSQQMLQQQQQQLPSQSSPSMMTPSMSMSNDNTTSFESSCEPDPIAETVSSSANPFLMDNNGNNGNNNMTNPFVATNNNGNNGFMGTTTADHLITGLELLQQKQESVRYYEEQMDTFSCGSMLGAGKDQQHQKGQQNNNDDDSISTGLFSLESADSNVFDRILDLPVFHSMPYPDIPGEGQNRCPAA